MEAGIDLWALRVFLAVCESGSMTEAAAALRLTQPAISRIVQELERGIGTQLLDRTLRPMRTTAAGEALREGAERVIQQTDRLVAVVRETSKGGVALLRIGLIECIVSLLAPLLVEEFGKMSRRIAIWEGYSGAHREAVLRRDLDLAVISDTFEDDGLERVKLAREPHILLVPAAFKGRPIASLGDLAKELPLMRHSARTYTGGQVDRYLRRIGLRIPVHFEFDSNRLVVSMVSAGRGWAITTPLALMATHYDPALIDPRPIPERSFSRHIVIISRGGEFGGLPLKLAATAAALLNSFYLSTVLKRMPWLEGETLIGL